MNSFNMPPGCSVRDIPGYDAPDPSAESERVCELLDAEPVTSDEVRDEIVALVDRLAEERDSLRCLLSQALKVLPIDPELQCICNASDAFSHCPIHDGSDPTLRQEIQAALATSSKGDVG